MEFIVGQEYRRSELHDKFGGNRQSGISSSKNHPIIFLFTGETGEQYGYRDGFQKDGIFRYSGEGQDGDMQMSRGNLAIKNSANTAKSLHLFERSRRGFVTYLGEAEYLDHHESIAPDKKGINRKVYVFELALQSTELKAEVPTRYDRPARQSNLWKKDLSELRNSALETPKKDRSVSERKRTVRARSEAVKIYVQRRADGICESCESKAPFIREDGTPYLEPHHIRRLADGGPDHPRWVAAICPNCHRRIHSGADGDKINSELAAKIGRKEL